MTEPADAPIFSVVMATYQRRDVLARTLPTVLEQDFPTEKFEVIVVVDGSTDGTVEMLASLGASRSFRVVEQPNRGPAVARQTALSAARGKYVFFTDDDIRLTPPVLKDHLAEHNRHSTPVMVRGSIFVAPESPPTLATDATRKWYQEHAESFDPEKNGVQLPQDFSIFANTSVLRSEVEACGGVDVSVPFPQEGFELLYRLLKRGIPLRSAPDAVVYEVFSKPTRKMITSDARGLGKAEWLLCQKHPEYRKWSVFANLGQGSPAKRMLRRVIMSAPAIPSLVLDTTIYLAEKLRRFAPFRKIGIRALGHRYRTEMLQSGLRQAGSWKAVEASFGVRLPVLMYHHVGPRNPSTYYELTIEPREFARQVRYLARKGYRTIFPSDWVRWQRYGTSLPKKPVLLTFDDAYADIFEFAFPILAEHDFCAITFVVSSLVGGMDVWNETRLSRSVLKLATPKQIAEWMSRGIENGVHTRTHADLTLLDQGGLDEEIVGSKEDLGRMTGKTPESFAYPFGKHNTASEAVVRSNFESAFSVMPGLNTLRTDPHLLSRTMVDPRNSLRQLGQMLRNGRNCPLSYLGRIRRKLWLRSVDQSR